mmetsp:Transcript_23058/g.71855  ORF Transcript_23058/g.71855 Transcript_23058/m.71855 type:complete len:212 (-) Transcript_23058:119-754(-)
MPATAPSCGWHPCPSSSARPPRRSSSLSRGSPPTRRTRASLPRRLAACWPTSSCSPWRLPRNQRQMRALFWMPLARLTSGSLGTRAAGVTTRYASLHRRRQSGRRKPAGTGVPTLYQYSGHCGHEAIPTTGILCLQVTLDPTRLTRLRWPSTACTTTGPSRTPSRTASICWVTRTPLGPWLGKLRAPFTVTLGSLSVGAPTSSAGTTLRYP